MATADEFDPEIFNRMEQRRVRAASTGEPEATAEGAALAVAGRYVPLRRLLRLIAWRLGVGAICVRGGSRAGLCIRTVRLLIAPAVALRAVAWRSARKRTGSWPPADHSRGSSNSSGIRRSKGQ